MCRLCVCVLINNPSFEHFMCLDKTARLAFRKSEKMTMLVHSVLSELHWLPVKFSVEYNLASQAHCTLLDGSLLP